MVGLRLAMRALGLLSTLVLARLLTPEDFGLVALATSLAAVLEVAASLGVDEVLIARARLTRADYDTAWTLELLRGLAMAALLVLAAPALAAFFDEPRLEPLLWWVALAVLLECGVSAGTVDFRRQLDFAREFHWQFWPRLLGVITAISLAWMWRSYWALVAGILVRRAGMLVLSYGLSPYRPKLALTRARELFAVARWLLINNALTFFRDRIDTLVVGKFAGAGPLGLYELANELASLPTTEIAGPATRAIYPGYARLAGDRAALRAGYVRSLALLLTLTLPMGVGIALLAEPAIALLLGPAWLGAVPLVQALAVYGLLRATYAPARAVYLALGRFRTEPALLLVSVILAGALLLLWVPVHGAFGAALAMTLTAAVMLLLHTHRIGRLLALSAGELMAPLARPLVATGVMALALLALPPQPSPLLTLLLAVPLGGAVWLLVLMGLWWRAGRPDDVPEALLWRWLGRMPALAVRWRAGR